MTQSYKPSGHSTVSPYLIVDGVAATIEFLEHVFGAQEISRSAGPEDTINHAEVRLDETVLMLSDGVEEWPAIPAHIHIYVSDVEQVYRRALEAGAKSVQEPMQKGDPNKRGGVTFPAGMTWWIATHLGED